MPIDEQTYAYEQQTSNGNASEITVVNNQNQSNTGISPADLIKRDNSSTERDVSISSSNAVFVSSHQPNDENENLRFVQSGHQVRYDDEQYHHRYEYNHHPSQNQATPSNNHVNAGEEIKVELLRHQPGAKVHIYDNDGNAHRTDEQNPQNESKIHYTNLDSIVPSQNYYITAEGYQPGGNGFTYLPAGSNKDYTVYHQGSPNTVLYKG